jgi:hypothetical protein
MQHCLPPTLPLSDSPCSASSRFFWSTSFTAARVASGLRACWRRRRRSGEPLWGFMLSFDCCVPAAPHGAACKVWLPASKASRMIAESCMLSSLLDVGGVHSTSPVCGDRHYIKQAACVSCVLL